MNENFVNINLFHLSHVRKSDSQKVPELQNVCTSFLTQDLEQSPDKTIRIQDLVQPKNSPPNQITKPKAKIPEVKVTPSSKEQKMEPYPSQRRTEAESPNQLSVPKTRKSKKGSSLGTTTLLMNPVHKNSASEVAKRSGLKFTTCCPSMFKPIKLVKNCYKWTKKKEKRKHYYTMIRKKYIIC